MYMSELSDILANPIMSLSKSQQIINNQKMRLFNDYIDENNNIKCVTYKISNNEISIPAITMVNIPSFSINKFKVSLNVEDKTNLKVATVNQSSKWTTHKIDMEVVQEVESTGFHRLNALLLESIKLKTV